MRARVMATIALHALVDVWEAWYEQNADAAEFDLGHDDRDQGRVPRARAHGRAGRGRGAARAAFLSATLYEVARPAR